MKDDHDIASEARLSSSAFCYNDQQMTLHWLHVHRPTVAQEAQKWQYTDRILDIPRNC